MNGKVLLQLETALFLIRFVIQEIAKWPAILIPLKTIKHLFVKVSFIYNNVYCI